MSAEEAQAVLGLTGPPTHAEVRAAHRRLMQLVHPDRGGTDYLAMKINRAKDVLLGKAFGGSRGARRRARQSFARHQDRRRAGRATERSAMRRGI